VPGRAHVSPPKHAARPRHAPHQHRRQLPRGAPHFSREFHVISVYHPHISNHFVVNIYKGQENHDS
jgi:hypothetical protein